MVVPQKVFESGETTRLLDHVVDFPVYGQCHWAQMLWISEPVSGYGYTGYWRLSRAGVPTTAQGSLMRSVYLSRKSLTPERAFTAVINVLHLEC